MARKKQASTVDERIEEVTGRLMNTRKTLADDPSLYASSGSTLIDLACTGTIGCCVKGGCYYLLWGDSSSGKTWLAQSVMAEIARTPWFDGHTLVYDASENGVQMNVGQFFGQRYADRVIPPYGTVAKPAYSRTLNQMYKAIEHFGKHGPFVFVEDSFDALDSDVADEKDKYQVARAKQNSSGMRDANAILADTGSVLIGIAQSRDYIGFGMKDKTRSGGRALKFYAQLEVITSVRGDMTQTVNGKPRKVGNYCRMHVEKNRTMGIDQTFDVPIHNSYGIDDLGACVDYLISEGRWSKAKGAKDEEEKFYTDATKIVAPDFDFEGKRGDLIAMVEEKGRQGELRGVVAEVWTEIQEGCVLKRQVRYD